MRTCVRANRHQRDYDSALLAIRANSAARRARLTDSPPTLWRRPNHPANVIPYTVRSGDTVGTIAEMFGVTPEDIARANRMHVDDELQVDEVLKVPHPFTTEVTNLKSQIETLSAQQQAAEQKSDSAQEQVKTLQRQVQDLTSQNQDLQPSVSFLPWWRATAISLGDLCAIYVRRDAADAVRMVADAAQVHGAGGDDRCAQPARLQV